MLRHPYDTPTFKTKVLRLVTNEGRIKHLLLLYKRLIQPYLSLVWLQLVTHFVIFHPYDTPTFKTKALRLVTIEGGLKRLLLLYKWLIQPYLSLLWLLLAMHFVTRVTPIDDIDGKSHKTEPLLFYQSFKVKITPLVIYSLGGGHTHTHTHTHTGGMKVISVNQARAGLWPARAWFNSQRYSVLSPSLMEHSAPIEFLNSDGSEWLCSESMLGVNLFLPRVLLYLLKCAIFTQVCYVYLSKCAVFSAIAWANTAWRRKIWR